MSEGNFSFRIFELLTHERSEILILFLLSSISEAPGIFFALFLPSYIFSLSTILLAAAPPQLFLPPFPRPDRGIKLR